MNYLTVVPAYGRDYKSQAEVKAAFARGDDFRICDMSSRHDGAYINKAEVVGNLTLMVRYAKLTKVVNIRG
jgi:hypothetical protein